MPQIQSSMEEAAGVSGIGIVEEDEEDSEEMEEVSSEDEEERRISMVQTGEQPS